MKVRVKLFREGAKMVSVIPQGDWVDIALPDDVELKAGEFRLIPLGIGMKLPEGYEAWVVPRSSTFMKYGVLQANSFGVIDNSYGGDDDEWHFPAYATRDASIPRGARVCQFRIMPKQPQLEFEAVDRLGGESRGGLGSTGV